MGFRRSVSLGLSFLLFTALAGCGDEANRDRNVQTLVGQACRTLGQTKTVSKVVHVCGRNGDDLVWYAAVARKPKGAKCTRPGGFRIANGKRLACAVINKKRMWVEVQELPFAQSTTSLVATPSTTGVTTTAPVAAPESATPTAEPAFAALAPPSAVPRDDVPSRGVTAEEVVSFAKTNLPPVRLVQTSKIATSRNGAKVSPAPSFQMVDEAGGARPAAGVKIQVTSATVGAVVSGGVGVTDANGAVAFPNLVVSGPPGQVDIAVLAEGYEGSSFSLAHSAGDPVGLLVLDSTNSVKAGEVWMNSPKLQLVDVNGWEVKAKGLDFTLVATDAKGNTVDLGSAVTNDEGVVEFESFKLTKVGAWKVKVASSTDAIQSIEYDVEVHPADADRLAVVSAVPDQVVSGAVLPTALNVQLVDEFGNAVAQSGVKVVAAARKIDGVTLDVAGMSETTDENGVATFDELKITGVAGMIVVSFSTPENDEFMENRGFATVLVAGVPKTLVVGIEPWLARSGVVLGRVPSVYLEDASGNRVAMVGEEVQVVANGSVEVANGITRFDGDGVATFEGLSLKGTAGVVTLSFTYGTIATTFDIALVSGPLAKLRVKEHPRSLVAGESFSAVIELLDADDNLFPYQGISVLAKVEGKRLRGVISGTAGFVTLDGLSINASGRRTMTYEALSGSGNSLLVVATDVIVAPTTPSEVEVLEARDLSVVNDREFGNSNATIKIQVRDRLGNAVLANQTAKAFVVRSPGSYELTGDTAVTDESGIATFSKLKIVGKSGVYVLAFYVPGFNSVAYAAKVTLSGGMPVAMRIKRPLAGLANGRVASVQPIIEMVDSGGNVSPAMNVVVEAWITVGNARAYLGGEAASTNEGTATFTSIRGRGKPGPATVTYKTMMIKPQTETAVSQDVELAPGVAVSYKALNLGQSIASGTGVGRIAAYDVDGNQTPILAASIMMVIRSSIPTNQPKIWMRGTSQIVQGGIFDASNTRLYGLKNESGTLEIHIGGIMVLEAPVTFTSDPIVGSPGMTTGSIIGAILAKSVQGVPGISGGGRVIEIVDPNFESTTPEYFAGVTVVENRTSRPAVTKGKALVGLGASNTSLILASHAQRGSFGIAKSVADAVINGFGDWFLGSIDEYVLIERNLRAAGVPYPFATIFPIASSTDFNDSQMWVLDPSSRTATKFSWAFKFVAAYPLRFVG